MDQMDQPLQAHEIRAILALPEFQILIKTQRTVSLTLTALMLLLYFGFILLIAWRKDLLAIKLGEHLTLGLPLGLGLILVTCLLTGIYVNWANHRYDASVRALRTKVLEKSA